MKNKYLCCGLLSLLLVSGASLSSCNKENDVLPNQAFLTKGGKQEASALELLQSRGVFIRYKEPNMLTSLRSLSTGTTNMRIEQEVLGLLDNPEILSIFLEDKIDNPFERIIAWKGYKLLSQETQQLIEELSTNEQALAIYREGVSYIVNYKLNNLERARSFVYSQMLYSGPEHAVINKEILKVSGIFLIGTLRGGGLAGGLAALATYAISLL